MLHLTIPVAQAAQPRRIEVQHSQGQGPGQIDVSGDDGTSGEQGSGAAPQNQEVHQPA